MHMCVWVIDAATVMDVRARNEDMINDENGGEESGMQVANHKPGPGS